MELAWFSLLHPLVPRTFTAGFALALLPLPVLGYVYLIVRLLMSLGDAQWNPRMRFVLALILVLSVGGFIFGILWIAEAHFSNGELGYFWWHRQ
jgi:hypothetical protein